MADTMLVMDNYVHVDNLAVDQLMGNDLIEINGEVVELIAIASLKNGYALTFENEFGEKDILEFDDNAIFKLYVVR